MTQTSKSISAGAIDTGSHLSGDDIAWAMVVHQSAPGTPPP
jgi:hypothetical protein